MTTFHSLTVAKVEPETRDAVTITFAIPDARRRNMPPSGPASDRESPPAGRAAPLLLHLSQPLAGGNQRGGQSHRRRTFSRYAQSDICRAWCWR